MAISCDPNDLAALAKCFKCLPLATLQEVQTYLLCQIFNGGVSGTCVPTSAIITGLDIDWSVADLRFKTITKSEIYTFSNQLEAQTISVYITNTGAFAISWPAAVLWTGGIDPIQTQGAKTDIYTFTMVNGIIYGSYIQNLS